MSKRLSLSIVMIIVLTLTIYGVYYLLLHDNYLHSSISYIITHLNHAEVTNHLLVLGLLPIYIAMMIFGAIMLGVYLGSKLEFLYLRYTIKNK